MIHSNHSAIMSNIHLFYNNFLLSKLWHFSIKVFIIQHYFSISISGETFWDISVTKNDTERFWEFFSFSEIMKNISPNVHMFLTDTLALLMYHSIILQCQRSSLCFYTIIFLIAHELSIYFWQFGFHYLSEQPFYIP